MNTPITLAITGASGAQYGLRLLQVLTQHRIPVICLFSTAAKAVIRAEIHAEFPDTPADINHFLQQQLKFDTEYLTLPSSHDWFCSAASGSSAPKRMVVCPCSMGTLAAIAHGMSDNLIERAADVILKERGKLILVPRETPLSTLHLQNMLQLSQLGAIVMPAMTHIAHAPMAGKILAALPKYLDTNRSRLDSMRVA